MKYLYEGVLFGMSSTIRDPTISYCVVQRVYTHLMFVKVQG